MEINTPQPKQDSSNGVILKHTLADGSFHYDWMIEIPDMNSEHRLLTFRSESRPDQFHENDSFIALKLKNHRVRYLNYEGDIGSNRGRVSRLNTALCLSFMYEHSNTVRMILQWTDSGRAATEYAGSPVDDEQWLFHASKIDSHSDPASDILDH